MKEMIEQEPLSQIEEIRQISRWRPYKSYKDSGIKWLGKIPEHWRMWKLAHAFQYIGSGTTPPSSNVEYYDNGTIPWVNTSELRDGLIHDTAKKITKKAIAEVSSLKVYSPQTLLIAMYGATIGRVGILQIPATINQACCALSTSSVIKTQFLFYWFLAYKQQIVLFADGGGQQNINQEIIRSLRIPTPSIVEQRAIISFLNREITRINTLIDKREHMIKLLQERRTAVINQIVTKGLDSDVRLKDSGIEWLGKIPENWETRRVKYLSSFLTSGSRGWAQYYADDGAIFLRIGNLTRSSISLDLKDIQYVHPPLGTEGQRTRVHKNDVLISITAYIGSIAVIDEHIEEAYVSQHIALVRPKSDIINPKWIGYNLIAKFGQEQFQMLQNGGTKDGLGLDDVNNLVVLLPPLQDQESIVSYLDHETAKIDKLIAGIQQSIQKLKEYNTALISAAVTGKIDVRAEVDVESVGNVTGTVN